jgi:hypothetical protein
MSPRTALAAVVLAASLPPPIHAHDLYSHLSDEVGASGVQMLMDQRWIDVPDERIQYRALLGDTGETGGGHWCGSTNKPDFGTPNTLCMTKCPVLPPQSASVQIDLP